MQAKSIRNKPAPSGAGNNPRASAVPTLLDALDTINALKLEKVNMKADMRSLSNIVVMAIRSIELQDYEFASSMLNRARDMLVARL